MKVECEVRTSHGIVSLSVTTESEWDREKGSATRGMTAEQAVRLAERLWDMATVATNYRYRQDDDQVAIGESPV